MIPRAMKKEIGRIKTSIRKDDEVEVICGSSVGKRGRVLSVDLEKGRAIVQGVNFAKAVAVRPSQKNPRGGFIKKEKPIALSSIKIVCPKCKKAVRVGHVRRNINDKMRRVRVCKNTECGAEFEVR